MMKIEVQGAIQGRAKTCKQILTTTTGPQASATVDRASTSPTSCVFHPHGYFPNVCRLYNSFLLSEMQNESS